MPLILGLDLGTTTITAVALNTDTGKQAGCATRPNRAALPCVPGRSEWDIVAIAEIACEALRDLVGQFGDRSDLTGLGITGQQHGVVLVDRQLRPLTPFINWQDRRGGEEATSGKKDADLERTGCRLLPGYMATTLSWLRKEGLLPREATACFAMDYMTALLTGTSPTTDPTCAASGGVFDLKNGDWAYSLIGMLRLPRDLFPPVRPSGIHAGGLIASIAATTGLPAGLPIFAGIGDNQASFLGSVADCENSVLVNIGTGGQVAVWSNVPAARGEAEARPFPLTGFLLVSAGLTGGAAYAALEQFFRSVISEVAGVEAPSDVFSEMNRLAAQVPSGSDGLVCEPFFTGTRVEPDSRARWMNVSLKNFTPGHLARSLLEGMARTLAASRDQIASACWRRPTILIGAGNGIRANPLLGRILAERFGLPMYLSAHREEAACGAARLAAVRAGLFADLADSARLIQAVPL